MKTPAREPVHATARRGVLLSILAAYLTGLAFMGAWPTPVDRPVAGLLQDLLEAARGHPLTAGVSYMHVEGAANVLLFVPLGLIVALLLPVRRWWLAGVAGGLISAAIETVQYLAVIQRQGSLVDVVNNALGAVLGAVTIRIVRTHPALVAPPDPGAGSVRGGVS